MMQQIVAYITYINIKEETKFSTYAMSFAFMLHDALGTLRLNKNSDLLQIIFIIYDMLIVAQSPLS